MPRPYRHQAAGAFFHLTTRGNDRQAIYADAYDRQRFLVLTAKAVAEFEWRCLAYCLMGNHYHLLIQTLEPTLSAGMQWLNGGYARSFNLRHRRQDHVFGRRFHSEFVEDESHLFSLIRYVPRNPLRAGLCARPEDWPWSSYRATAGLAPTPTWLDASWLLAQFDADPRRAIARYVLWVDQPD